MSYKLVRASAAGAAALLLTLIVAACGGSARSSEQIASVDGSSQTATAGDGAATTEKQDPEEAAVDYARCMREHGVDMPDPSAGGGISLNVQPGEEAEVEEAQKACDPILENAAPRLSEEQQNAMQEAQLAFAKCMREHGIDMPDPQFGANGVVTQQGSSDVDPNDPDFREAEEACRPIVEEAASKAGLPDGEGGVVQSFDEGS